MTQVLDSVEVMLRDGATRQEVLKTMPKRPLVEQQQVWSEGLARIAQRITAASNRAAGTVVERVVGGQVHGMFYDPLDVAEAYCKDELRRSRSREEGERSRQRWLMDLLVKIGEARGVGAQTLADYPPAAAMMESAPAEEPAG